MAAQNRSSRQILILEILTQSSTWSSITDIDQVLYQQGHRQSRRTIARELRNMAKNGIIQQMKEKSKFFYKAGKNSAALNFTEAELHVWLSSLDSNQRDTIRLYLELLRSETMTYSECHVDDNYSFGDWHDEDNDLYCSRNSTCYTCGSSTSDGECSNSS